MDGSIVIIILVCSSIILIPRFQTRLSHDTDTYYYMYGRLAYAEFPGGFPYGGVAFNNKVRHLHRSLFDIRLQGIALPIRGYVRLCI